MSSMRIVMKIGHLILGVLLLSIMLSPALAISKSDLISQHRTESNYFFEKLRVPDTPAPSPSISPTPQPTTLPTPAPTYSFVSTGSLMVTTTPIRANVYIDDTIRGTSPVKITGLSGGIHQLKVTKEKYHDYSTEVIVSNERTSSISVRLAYNTRWPLPPPDFFNSDPSCIETYYP